MLVSSDKYKNCVVMKLNNTVPTMNVPNPASAYLNVLPIHALKNISAKNNITPVMPFAKLQSLNVFVLFVGSYVIVLVSISLSM